MGEVKLNGFIDAERDDSSDPDPGGLLCYGSDAKINAAKALGGGIDLPKSVPQAKKFKRTVRNVYERRLKWMIAEKGKWEKFHKDACEQRQLGSCYVERIYDS